VPSGPPLSVKVKEINANTVQVSWDPPKLSHQNGVITGYVVSGLSFVSFNASLSHETCEVAADWSVGKSVGN